MTEKPSLTAALETRAQPQEQVRVIDLFDRMRPELEKSLRTPEAVDILTRHYMNAIRFSPLLMQCTADSQAAAILLSAQMRLEPGPLGLVYLIPKKIKDVWQVLWLMGYTGIIELSRRTERVAGLEATVVWDCDTYSAPRRDEKGIHYSHAPGPEDQRNERLRVLVTWQERQGSKWLPRAIDVPKSRIDRAKDASAAYKAKSGPWLSDETAMWAKTGIRAVRAWLPLSPEFAQAMQADESVALGIEKDDTDTAQPRLAVDETADVVIEG